VTDPLFTVADRIVLITGGLGAIGGALCRGFAARGARVAAFDLPAAPEAGLPAGVEVLRGDATDAVSVAGAVQALLARHGRIDVLVNAAGINQRAPALELDEALFDRIMAANVKSTLLFGQAVGRHMVARRAGVIVNFASIAGLYGVRTSSAYSAAKAAVIQLTRAWAAEWAPAGVRVNAIAPTAVRTAMMEPVLAVPEKRDALLARIPLGRVMEVDDLLGSILYLATDASAFVTGHVLVIDGGRTATI